MKIELPEEESKLSLKITLDQCESHLSYMQILNTPHQSNQQPNQSVRIATPSSIRNISPADFVTI